MHLKGYCFIHSFGLDIIGTICYTFNTFSCFFFNSFKRSLNDIFEKKKIFSTVIKPTLNSYLELRGGQVQW